MVHFLHKWSNVAAVSFVQGCPSRGPIVPILIFFVIAQQVLFSNIEARIRHSHLTAYKVGIMDLHVSHLFYADNVLIFTNGISRSPRRLMRLIRSYENSLGQQICLNKSALLSWRHS